jgi:hypothetical protein
MRVNLTDVLSSLPYDKRMALLICSVIEHDKHNAFVAVKGMVRVTSVMSRYLSVSNRYRIAEIMRDHADKMEHEQPVFISAS